MTNFGIGMLDNEGRYVTANLVWLSLAAIGALLTTWWYVLDRRSGGFAQMPSAADEEEDDDIAVTNRVFATSMGEDNVDAFLRYLDDKE